MPKVDNLVSGPQGWSLKNFNPLHGLALIAVSAYAGYWYANRQQTLSVPSEEKPSTFAPLTQQPPAAPSELPKEQEEITQQYYGYTNKLGGYALNYPATWKGEETGEHARFITPEEVAINIVVEENSRGFTLEEFVAYDLDFPPAKVLSRSNIEIGSVPAIRLELALPETDQRISVVVYFIRAGKTYSTGAYPITDLPSVVVQFDQMLSTFKFLD